MITEPQPMLHSVKSATHNEGVQVVKAKANP